MEENVTATEVSTRSTGVRYGIIGGLIGIAYFLILTTLGVDMSGGISRWAGSLITLVIIILAHNYYKANGDGFMTFGGGVGIGFWIGLVSSVISSIFTYIYVKFIDPSFITAIREKAIADMEAQGQSQEAIDRAMPFMEMFMKAETIFFMGLFFGVLITVVIALIVSIFTQKPRPETSI
jgi:hypothetical protein